MGRKFEWGIVGISNNMVRVGFTKKVIIDKKLEGVE